MGIFDAMLAGLSGLKAQSQSMGIISDNIANVNSVGYKGAKARFSTFVTTSPTTTHYAAGGVRSFPLVQVDKQGLVESSDSSTDLAVVGRGFFVVNSAQQPTPTDTYSFTRAGAFTLDSDGYLVNTAGFYLQGWPTDSAGVPTPANLSSVNNLSTINVANVAGTAKPTTQVTLGANLPASAAIGATTTTNVLIYDALGVAHNLAMTWTKTATNAWSMAVGNPTLASNSATVTGTTTGGGGTMTFNGNGTPATITMANVTITPWTTGANASNIALNFGTVNMADGVTQFSSNYSTNFINQDGIEFGEFSDVTIDDNGLVTALFENGDSLPIYKIPLATFNAPNGLKAKSGNVFSQTNVSGQYTLNPANVGRSGLLAPSALESANVDLGTEFTNMIVTQRAYSAAAKIITTSDEMINELVNIKR